MNGCLEGLALARSDALVRPTNSAHSPAILRHHLQASGEAAAPSRHPFTPDRWRDAPDYTPFSSNSAKNCLGSVNPNNRSGTSASLLNCAIFPNTGKY